MAKQLPKLADVEQLSGSVVRILGGNGGKFTLQGTNTYLLGTNPKSLILLDTAQGFEAWRSHISSYLSENKMTVSKCVLTHWHTDHVRGVPDLLSLSPGAILYKHQGKSLDPEEALQEYEVQEIQDGQRFDDGDGFEIEAVHSPGHTEDHMSFIITSSKYPEEIGRMFTGDNVLGHGTAVFENLATYLKSLSTMRNRISHEVEAMKLKDENVWAYPSHGAVIRDSRAKIDEYISHRKLREDEALNVLRNGTTKSSTNNTNNNSSSSSGINQEWDAMDMVKVIYKDVPESLHLPAQGSLLQVLYKLKGEGRVVCSEDGKWKLGERSAL